MFNHNPERSLRAQCPDVNFNQTLGRGLPASLTA